MRLLSNINHHLHLLLGATCLSLYSAGVTLPSLLNPLVTAFLPLKLRDYTGYSI